MFFRGYKLASPGAIVTIICFFLPWLFISCYGQPIGQYSGFEMAVGPQISTGFGVEQTPPTPLLFTPLVAGGLVLGLAYVAAQRGRLNWLDTLGLVVLGIGSALLVVIQVFDVEGLAELAEQGILVEFRIGVWGTLIGLLLIAGGGVMNLVSAPTSAPESLDTVPELH